MKTTPMGSSAPLVRYQSYPPEHAEASPGLELLPLFDRPDSPRAKQQQNIICKIIGAARIPPRLPAIKLSAVWLTTDCQPEPGEIRRRLEHMVERGVLTRKTDHLSMYVYAIAKGGD